MKFLILTVVSLSLTFFDPGYSAAQESGADPDTSTVDVKPRLFLGLRMKPAQNENGVMVVKIVPGSPAEKAEFHANDIITVFDGEKPVTIESLLAKLGGKKIGDEVIFTVRRDDEDIEIAVVIGDRNDFKIEGPSEGLEVNVPTTTTYPSRDQLEMTLDAYAPYGASAPIIVLCHQAGWSRGEYREIAPKLNRMGFNCFAIDQRSGGSVNDVVNETNKLAAKEGKGVAFLDAEQDMVAALELVHQFTGTNKAKPKVILWGSSYSAALSLRIAGEHPELVDGVMAFAPGEYFERFGKPADWIETSANKIACPAFITSAKKELENWESIYDSIPGDSKMMFLPETDGNHGSRALWEKFDDHEDYWKATKTFLSQFNHNAATLVRDNENDDHDHNHDANEKLHTHESDDDK